MFARPCMLARIGHIASGMELLVRLQDWARCHILARHYISIVSHANTNRDTIKIIILLLCNYSLRSRCEKCICTRCAPCCAPCPPCLLKQAARPSRARATRRALRSRGPYQQARSELQEVSPAGVPEKESGNARAAHVARRRYVQQAPAGQNREAGKRRQ